MKHLPLILAAVVAIGCGAVAFSQHESNAALRNALAAADAKAAAEQARLADELAKLRAQNDIYKNESTDLRKKLAEKIAAPDAVVSADAAEPAKEGEPKKKEDNNFMSGIAKMYKDPEMKKVMRAQQAMGIRMMYSDLAKELGLSPDEATRVMELLADRQMAISAKSMEAFGGGGETDPAKMEEVGKTIASSREEYDAQLKSVLGDAKMAKLTDYERSLGDRMQLNQIQQSLSATGTALKDNEKQGLLNIMKEERQKSPANVFDPANKDVSAQMKALQSEDSVNQLIQSSEDFNDRVLARARTVLSPDQTNAFETAQKQQLDMMKMGVKMGAAMFKKNSNSAPVAPPTPVPAEAK